MPANKNQIRRIQTILKMMRQNRYPNFTSFFKEMKCQDVGGAFRLSRKTFSRDIADLRDEYGAPVHYDTVRKGFFLSNPEWYNEDLMIEPFEMKSALLGERIAAGILPDPLRGEISKAVSALLMKNESGMDAGVGAMPGCGILLGTVEKALCGNTALVQARTAHPTFFHHSGFQPALGCALCAKIAAGTAAHYDYIEFFHSLLTFLFYFAKSVRKFSRLAHRACMKRAAGAPSTTRWSKVRLRPMAGYVSMAPSLTDLILVWMLQTPRIPV